MTAIYKRQYGNFVRLSFRIVLRPRAWLDEFVLWFANVWKARAKTTTIVAKLLVLLAERDRLVVLPDLLASYRDRLLSYRKVVRAELTTSAPLDAATTEAIRQRLAQVTGNTVTLQTRVDPSIVGGLVAKVGTTVYDASVTRQLEKMRDQLAERA